ncbi:MAG TPA: hypothetical protein VHC63_15715 [Acidimicrobiales bacterium]|nr:hypothetical protein [Acidimicrobiales bacterium]
MIFVVGAQATPLSVAISPTSGANGTELQASSPDTCPAVPENADPTLVNVGPNIVYQVASADEPAPTLDSDGWLPFIQEQDGSFLDVSGTEPWQGYLTVGATGGWGALDPGAYRVSFACGYATHIAGVDAGTVTNGPWHAYGEITGSVFDLCATAPDCGTPAPTTSTSTSTTVEPEPTTVAPPPATTTTEPEVTPGDGIGESSASPGGEITIDASGFLPGTEVVIEFHSTPHRIGSVTADARGRVKTAAWVPVDAEVGTHHVVLTGTDATGKPKVESFAIVVSRRPAGRGSMALPVMIGFALLAVAVAASVGVRRFRAAR